MTNILLIRPHSNIRTLTPPIGLMYISAYLKKDNSVVIVDGRLCKVGFKGIMKSVKNIDPEMVGITCMTPEFNSVKDIAKYIKNNNKSCKVVVGGSHANADPIGILKDNNIDFVVCGEGEETMVELSENTLKKEIKGIAFRYGDSVVINQPRDSIDDDTPFPDYDSIEMEDYFKSDQTHGQKKRKHERYMPIFTSRGCPFNCIYCHKIFGRKFRPLTPKRVFEEIKFLYEKYGIREIHIEDDSFNINMDRAKEICDLIIESKIKINIAFPNGIRADLIDVELIEKLKKSGTYTISYGVETVSPRIMKLIKKNLSIDKVKNTIKLTVNSGIHAHGFFMIGFPGETKDEMLQTINFAKSSKLDDYGISIVVPFPGTELYDNLLENNHIFTSDYSEYQQPMYDYSFSNKKISELSNIEMINLIKEKGIRNVYLHNAVMLKRRLM